MMINVDRNKCSGIGLCEAMSPDFFEVDDGAYTGALSRES